MESNNEMQTKEISKGQKAKGENGRTDCVVRAITAAFEVSYEDAHEFVEKNFGRKKNRGTQGTVLHITEMIEKRKSFKGKSFKKLKVEQYTNLYGRNLRKSTLARFTEKNPKGTYLVQKRNHLLAVIDGVVLDGTKPKSKVTAAFEVK